MAAPPGWSAYRGLADTQAGPVWEYVYHLHRKVAGRSVNLRFEFTAEETGLVDRLVKPVVASSTFR